jgi:3-dehydroquinate synthase
VAIGMVYVAELARLAGRLDEQTCALHRTVLASVGLPTAYPAGVWRSLREAMAVDKKARSAGPGGTTPPKPPLMGGNRPPHTPAAPRSRLRLVVLDGLARPSILEDPSEELLRQAYQEVSR